MKYAAMSIKTPLSAFDGQMRASLSDWYIVQLVNMMFPGDYTLVNIPWSGATSLAFNDSTAATISTLGNAALLVGGLYLLSGFPSALARSDPFGVQRRFGKPAPPAKMFKPRGEAEQERKRGRKKTGGRHQRQRGVERRGPGGVRQAPEERTLALPQFSLPETERQFRVPQFRPFQLRMPSLPSLRLPSFPGLGRRPQSPRPAAPQTSQSSPPAPAPQSARPAPQSARPAPQSARPAPQSAPQSARPAPQSSRPAPQSARPAPASQSPRPQPQSSRPAARPQASRPPPPVQAARPPVIPPVQEQSAPLNLPNPRPVAQSDFGGAFDTDPFQEFQTAEYVQTLLYHQSFHY